MSRTPKPRGRHEMAHDLLVAMPYDQQQGQWVAQGLAELERFVRLHAEFQAYLAERGETE